MDPAETLESGEGIIKALVSSEHGIAVAAIISVCLTVYFCYSKFLESRRKSVSETTIESCLQALRSIENYLGRVEGVLNRVETKLN